MSAQLSFTPVEAFHPIDIPELTINDVLQLPPAEITTTTVGHQIQWEIHTDSSVTIYTARVFAGDFGWYRIGEVERVASFQFFPLRIQGCDCPKCAPPKPTLH